MFNRQTDRQVRRADGPTYIHTYTHTDRQTRTYTHTDRQIRIRTDRRTKGERDGRTDFGKTFEQTDNQSVSQSAMCHQLFYQTDHLASRGYREDHLGANQISFFTFYEDVSRVLK